ncbi:MAG: sigma-70 family RNA polymerase sigma factor [Bacteroidales bacterium]|nr:sigma-70 family RNA polymerase sigma factor [Bacteroidales bacterium]
MHLVYGVCLKYFKNREDAKDGAAAIFEKLIIETQKHDIEQFKTWLYVLTKNFCLMKIRAEKSTKQKKVKWEIEQDAFVESSYEMHPLDEVNRSVDNILMDCIDKLKKEQQECIRLFYFKSKSYREISKLTGAKEKKVKSCIQNGKRNLKICIEKTNEEEEKQT